MNILLEISDSDLIFIGLAFVALILFGVVIFYIVTKGNNRTDDEDDYFEEEKKPKELTDEQQKAKEELERVFNQMSADLEAKNPEPEVIETFEREQEENAIISYQELIKQVEARKKAEQKPARNEEYLKETLKSEEPYLENLDKGTAKSEPYLSALDKKEEKSEPYLEKEEKPKEEPKKFKNSEIISPIFGIQSEPSHAAPRISRQEVEEAEPARHERIDASSRLARHTYEEVKVNYDSEDNSEFLNSLKEFRRNL